MPAIRPLNPFDVKDEFAFFEGLLGVYWAGMGGPEDLAPARRLRPRVLDRESAQQWAARLFLEGVLPVRLGQCLDNSATPAGLAESGREGAEGKRSLPVDLAESTGERTRAARLWQRSPELVCEAFGRLDLRSLVVTARERFLEYWEMYMDVERALSELTERDRGRARLDVAEWSRVAAHWFEEAREREEVWTLLFADHLRAELELRGRSIEAPARCPEADLRSAIAGAVQAAAGDSADPASFARLAILAVPGICLLDVREMIPSKCLSRKTWTDVCHELLTHESLQSCARVVTEEQEDEILGRSAKSGQGSLDLDRLASPLTRILWARDVYRAAADQIWELWQSPRDHEGIRSVMERVREGLRGRFWHTRDPHYRQLALVFRFAASRKGSGSRSIDNATQRFRREVLALRRQGYVAWEAGLHRWMHPHCAQVTSPGDDPTLWTTFHRIELWATGLHALWSWVEGWESGEMGRLYPLVKGQVVHRFHQRARALVTVNKATLTPPPGPSAQGSVTADVREFLSSFWAQPSLIQATRDFLTGPGLRYLHSRVAPPSVQPAKAQRQEPEILWLGLRVVQIIDLLQKKDPAELVECREKLPWDSDLDKHLAALHSSLRASSGLAAHPTNIADDIDRDLKKYLANRKQPGRAELEMLAAVHRWIEDATVEWDPAGAETRMGALVAERLLNQIIKSSEKERLDYARMVARLTWALELPLVLARSPDVARLGPAVHVLEERAGRSSLEQLEQATQEVALRAFIWRELSQVQGTRPRWTDVNQVAKAGRRRR
jgi:hypothetical protein